MARLHVVAVVFALVAAVSASDLDFEKPVDIAFSLGEGRELSESGSGSPPPPPPPSPFSPPGTPGAAVIQIDKVVVTMIASGLITDYTPERRTAMKTTFANQAQVDTSAVELIITQGSVVIQANIIVADQAAAASVQQSMATVLATPESATQFFVDAGVTGVSVVSAPVVVKVEETVVEYPPTPPSPPIPMAAVPSNDDGMDGGAIAGAVIGSLIGAALIVAGIMFALKGSSGGSKDSSAGVMFTNVGANAQENV